MGEGDGALVRALASDPTNVARVQFQPCGVYHWFLPCSEDFSPGSPVLLPPQKPTSPNSNLTRTGDPHENQLRLMWIPL